MISTRSTIDHRSSLSSARDGLTLLDRDRFSTRNGMLSDLPPPNPLPVLRTIS
jgi:hypothetical protein